MAKILIGFMGSGKSTIAKLLDEHFIDMDAVIMEKIGMPIVDFFASQGEAKFRDIEAQVLQELAQSSAVVATGGGVVVNAKNREILSQNGETIYLKTDFETLYDRIAKDTDNQRPLFITNSKEDFKAIFDQRQDWYAAAANQIIDVTGKTPEQILEEIR